jgi:DNA segregation ATPase FtsK/SpoIIIE-like protein
VDEALLGEAVELLGGTRRVTAALLQRRLRIDYQQAMDVMVQLASRGLVELEADASQGRVVV